MVTQCSRTQTSSTGVAGQSLAASVAAGVEELCDCGFSPDNFKQTIIQCFPDNPARINVLLLLQATPLKNTSEIVRFLNAWIASGPQVVLDDSNTTVGVSEECDVTVILGSECVSNTEAPPTSSSISSPSPSPGPSNPTTNETSTEPTVANAAAKGRDLTAAGGTMLALALVFIAVAAVAVVVILVRYRIIKFKSFSV